MPPRHILSLWLFFCAFMVLGMTALGSITRLTESGLSITEWNVMSGSLPPLNETDWQDAFDKYQKTPEYVQKHHWMSLSDFKGIFFWEWFHRLWGRLIGVVFLLPFLFFWKKGWIEGQDKWKYIGLFMLGGLQGGVGWFMVKSGLVDRPSVSHFRLAAHLMMAITIYAALLWTAYGLRAHAATTPPATTRKHGIFLVVSLAVTIMWGAFVAGLHAGHLYNTFPNMGAGIVPPEFGQAPFLTDAATVQFTHRVLALITFITALIYGARLWRCDRSQAIAVLFFVSLQFLLGVGTLLSNVWIVLAVAHQINALLLMGVILYTLSPWASSRRLISDA